MASIHKKNGLWYISYTDGNGIRHFPSSGIEHSPIGKDRKDTIRKTAENRRKATIRANQIETAAQSGHRASVVRKLCAEILAKARQTDAEQSGVTVRDYYDRWVDEKLLRVSDSYAGQLKCCKGEFYTFLGSRADVEIVYIDEDDIEAFVAYLQETKLGGRSINKRLNMLEEMFGDAEKKSHVIVPPVTNDHFVDECPVERLFLLPEQTERIMAATNIVDWHTTTLLGFYCGKRLGDARSQLWEAIDFERRVIFAVPQKTLRAYDRKAKVLITPIHPVLYEHLLKVRDMSGDSPYVTPSLATRPISNLSAEFVALVRAAGIDPIEITLPNGRKICLLTFHSTRHGFVTLLKRAGTPDKEWSQLTGHSIKWGRWDGERISKVAQIYNHVEVEDLRKWVDLLPALKVPSAGSASAAKS
jgi:integrase